MIDSDNTYHREVLIEKFVGYPIFVKVIKTDSKKYSKTLGSIFLVRPAKEEDCIKNSANMSKNKVYNDFYNINDYYVYCDSNGRDLGLIFLKEYTDIYISINKMVKSI